MDIIVVTFNSAEDVRPCLDSIIGNYARPIVVDNGSVDATLQILHDEYPQVALLVNPGNGYARAANLGMSNSNSPFTIVSNADVIYPAHTVADLMKYVNEHPDIGVLGPQQIYPNGSWQRSWGVTPGLVESLLELIGATSLYNGIRRGSWPRRVNRKPRKVGYVDGACMVVNRTAYNTAGGFDESFRFYAEEADLCVRIRKAGWRIVALPTVTVVHRRGASSTKAGMSYVQHATMMAEASEKLIGKHHGKLYLGCYRQIKRLFNLEMAWLVGLIVHVAPEHRKAALRRKFLMHEAYYSVFGSRRVWPL